MSFTLSIKGQDTNIYLGKDSIVSFDINTSTEKGSLAKTNIVATMIITGKLLSNKNAVDEIETEKLLKWSLVPPENQDAYRNVVIEATTAGRIIRRINFPKAFVYDYAERFSDVEGVGEFFLVLRQKIDSVNAIETESGLKPEEEGEEEN